MIWRRLKIYEVSDDFLASFLKDREIKITKFSGIPHDATFIYAFHDDERRITALVYEHESFPIHYEGQLLTKDTIKYDSSDKIVNEYINKKWFKDRIRLANGRDDVTGYH